MSEISRKHLLLKFKEDVRYLNVFFRLVIFFLSGLNSSVLHPFPKNVGRSKGFQRNVKRHYISIANNREKIKHIECLVYPSENIFRFCHQDPVL